jgi:chemotaxis response regulator CheB
MEPTIFLKKLLTQCPIPVIIVSPTSKEHKQKKIETLSVGVIDFVFKPSQMFGECLDKALKQLREKTLAQDEKSSLIFDMPKAAFDAAGVEKLVPLERMTHSLVQ